MVICERRLGGGVGPSAVREPGFVGKAKVDLLDLV